MFHCLGGGGVRGFFWRYGQKTRSFQDDFCWKVGHSAQRRAESRGKSGQNPESKAGRIQSKHPSLGGGFLDSATPRGMTGKNGQNPEGKHPSLGGGFLDSATDARNDRGTRGSKPCHSARSRRIQRGRIQRENTHRWAEVF